MVHKLWPATPKGPYVNGRSPNLLKLECDIEEIRKNFKEKFLRINLKFEINNNI